MADDKSNNIKIQNQRILMLVEDSEVDRAVYRRYLKTDRNYHYTFIEVDGGEEALAQYSQSQVDLILLDYLLPDMNGLEWLAQWQQQYSKHLCPVIVLTGQGSQNVAVQFIKLGAADYLIKEHITAEQLKLAVSREIARKQLQLEKQDFTDKVQSQAEQLKQVNELLQYQINLCEISEQLIRTSKEKLQESETKFRNTFEQAAVGMAHVSPDGKWLMVNQKLCQIVGYSREELLQKTFQEITYPEDLESDLYYFRQILAGKISTYSIEKRYICKNNSIVWINLTVSLIRSVTGEPEYFISVIEDISDRKQLELSQQKTLQYLSYLHQTDRAILEAQHPQAIANIAIDYIQQLLTCQRTSIVTFDPKHNTATTLITQGRAKEMAGDGLEVALDIWQDLIDRLQESNQNYVITYLSQLPLLSTAIPSLSTAQLDCFICFPLRVQNKLLGILKLWVENIEVVTLAELNIISEISIQVAIALQQANLTQAIQNYALELETKVKERTTQLEEINQELKAFSYNISHDLKAPLRAIQGFAIALQEDYAEKLDDLGREYTQRLASSAQQMEKLIQDLLTYSRLSRSEIQKQSVDLVLIVNKALEELDSHIKEVQATITVDRPILKVLGNRTILLQIVSNLLSNGIKFVAKDVKPQIHIWTESKDDYVRLWVEDNGIGIEQKHQERIFQVFERLHGNEVYSGTGIGLAIVKKGTERLGGRFGLESEINCGSRFWIELPSIA